ncbi:hypothetical protein DS833_04910 [Lactobacillus bombicola]|nr:hypothetical protein DS833_04910 [Lactobacillus bombicola]
MFKKACNINDYKLFYYFRTAKKTALNYPLISYFRYITVPYIEGLPDDQVRWSRYPETGKGTYVDNMTFDEWKQAVDYQRKAQTIPNNATLPIKY